MIIQAICYFSPAFLALKVFEYSQKKALSKCETVLVYLAFVLLLNTCSLGVVAVIFHHPDYILNTGVFTVGFTFKYLLLSFTLAYIMPLLICHLLKNIRNLKEKLSVRERDEGK